MAKKSGLLSAHLALLAVNMIYGANYVIAKGVMPEKLSPNAFILARVLGAVILFWSIFLFKKEKVATKDFIRLALCGVFGVAVNQLFFFNGLNITSPINASIIMTITPILVLIMAALIIKEKITKQKLVGVLVGFSGAALLTILSIDSSRSGSIQGDIFVLINALSYGFYLVLVKPLMSKYKPITVISWVFLFGFMIVLPIGYQDLARADWQNFSLETYYRIGYVIIGVTFLTYLFNIYALKIVSPSVSSSYIYLQPVMSGLAAALFSWYGLEDYTGEITGLKIGATILIFIGVYLVSAQKKAKSA